MTKAARRRRARLAVPPRKVARPGGIPPNVARSLDVGFGTSRAAPRRMVNSIAKLTDAALIARLHQTGRECNQLLAERILLLIAVEDRRVYLRKATPSLFKFCLKELRLSEGEAYRRINAAKLVRRFPQLLDHIARGDIHLSALVQLRDHFTERNVDDLVATAKGKNKMQIAELAARLAPRPDVPARIRKLPQYDKGSRMTKASRPLLDPLSEARYRLQVTGSCEFRDKLFRARDLMMHSNPNGDLAVVVERALDELIEVLEKRKFGKLSGGSTFKSSSKTRADDRDPALLPTTARETTSPRPSSNRRPGLARASREVQLKEERPTRGTRNPLSSNEAVYLRQRKYGRMTTDGNVKRQRAG